MKYLYRVLDRRKQGNTSFYLVKNLKTNEEKVMPISWVRQEYLKGVFSNIKVSEDGKVSIVKDKLEEDILSKLVYSVKITEFLEDAKLDFLPFKIKDNPKYAIKKIDVLKSNYFEVIVSNCVKLTAKSEKFLKESVKGEILYEDAIGDYPYEYPIRTYYPSYFNENTSISFEVDKKELKDFLFRKGLYLSSKEFNQLEKAIIYSLLYYCHDWVSCFLQTKENIEYNGILNRFDKSGEKNPAIILYNGLEKNDICVLQRNKKYLDNLDSIFKYMTDKLELYDSFVTDYTDVFYNDRVRKIENSYRYEIYAHSAYFPTEEVASSFNPEYVEHEEEYDKYKYFGID